MKYIEDFDMVVLYRNDMAGNNETFGFDIRNLWDMSKVLYQRATTNKEWIDIGGRKNWRKYAFPVIKYTAEEAAEELGVNQEIVIVCPFQTFVLGKQNDGLFQKI